MTALGQSRRFASWPAVSGLPRGTDIVRPARLVRFVPMGDIAVASITLFASDLLNYSVSPREKRGWDFNTDCFSRLSIDEQVKSGRLLNW